MVLPSLKAVFSTTKPKNSVVPVQMKDWHDFFCLQNNYSIPVTKLSWTKQKIIRNDAPVSKIMRMTFSVHMCMQSGAFKRNGC